MKYRSMYLRNRLFAKRSESKIEEDEEDPSMENQASEVASKASNATAQALGAVGTATALAGHYGSIKRGVTNKIDQHKFNKANKHIDPKVLNNKYLQKGKNINKLKASGDHVGAKAAEASQEVYKKRVDSLAASKARSAKISKFGNKISSGAKSMGSKVASGASKAGGWVMKNPGKAGALALGTAAAGYGIYKGAQYLKNRKNAERFVLSRIGEDKKMRSPKLILGKEAAQKEFQELKSKGEVVKIQGPFDANTGSQRYASEKARFKSSTKKFSNQITRLYSLIEC